MPALSSPLSQITSQDLADLLGRWPEDETLEFKQTLSQSSSGKPDPWLVDQSGISPTAKRDLFAEVVAMANSYGGDVILGIEESDQKPPVATAIVPLPKCVELASRLELAARDLIHPQIPMLGVVGVPTEGDAGVVIFRVPRSRAAPHRLEISGTVKECYRRVSDRSEPMSMREIQDLTFSVSRGLERKQERLADAVRELEGWVRRQPSNMWRYGYAIVATPLTADLYFEKVHGNHALAPVSVNYKIRFGDHGRWIDCQSVLVPNSWRPILRGTEGTRDNAQNASTLRRVYCDGTVLEYFSLGTPVPSGDPGSLPLYSSWFLTSLMNCFETIDRFRAATNGHAVNYAIQVSLNARMRVEIMGPQLVHPDTLGVLQAGQVDLPLYELGERQDWPQVLTLIWRDFLNSANIVAGDESLSVYGW